MDEREVFGSWKEIAAYLRRDVRTCRRYERHLGLPVHRLDGSPRARVFAYKDEIDAWRDKETVNGLGLLGRLREFVRSRPVAAFLGFAFLAGAAVFLSLVLMGLIHSPDRLTIALLPFQNDPGRAELEEWTRRLPFLMAEDLSDSHYFSVIPEDEMTGFLRELGLAPGAAFSSDDLRRIGKKSGATHIVTGALLEAGGGLIAMLSTRRIGSQGSYSSRFACRDEAEIPGVAERMADQVKKDLGLTRSNEAGDYDAIGMPVTTSSPRAFRLYNEGRRLHVRGEYAASARIMRKAIARDPEFALAWRSLAASLGSQGDEAEHERCLRKAVELGRNASAQERYFIRAHYFQHTSEFGPAILISREWCERFPEDTEALLYLGRGLLFEEDMEGARAVLNEALRKGDRNPFLFFFASLACTALGRFDEAAGIRERALSIHPRNRLISSASEIDALVRGQWDRALAELESWKGDKPELSLELKRGDVLLLKGDFRGAEQAYASVKRLSPHAVTRLARLALAEGRYRKAAELAAEAKDNELLAYVESRRGRLDAGLEAAAKACEAARKSGHYLTELAALSIKGAIEARSGDLPAARASLARLGTTGIKGLSRLYQRGSHCLAGIIADAEGRPDRAVEEFEAAVALLSMDLPYLDDPPSSIGIVADMHTLLLYIAAQLQERAGHVEAACERYLRLIGLTGGRLTRPDLYALSYYALGRIRQDQGDPEGARESLTAFLELWKNADPGLAEVEDAKARLRATMRTWPVGGPPQSP